MRNLLVSATSCPLTQMAVNNNRVIEDLVKTTYTNIGRIDHAVF